MIASLVWIFISYSKLPQRKGKKATQAILHVWIFIFYFCLLFLFCFICLIFNIYIYIYYYVIVSIDWFNWAASYSLKEKVIATSTGKFEVICWICKTFWTYFLVVRFNGVSVIAEWSISFNFSRMKTGIVLAGEHIKIWNGQRRHGF